MKISLPQYSTRDYQVMLWVMMPFTLILNTIVFGNAYYTNAGLFISATIVTGIAVCINFILCGFIAVALKNRLPAEKQVPLRLTLMILTFLLFTGLFLYMLLESYSAINFFGYSFYEPGFIWSYIAMAILHVFITFVQEGISRYENWKQNLKETEALKNAYRQSQLQGLKSQVNPHFLFNSLNSLSSLISENDGEAERFLDEMSRVYRYMLRNDDDQLVKLETELKFIHSYIYLLRTRYGDGLQLSVSVPGKYLSKCIPPLTLQVLIENAVYQNAISRNSPLRISVYPDDEGNILVQNNIQPKIVTETIDHDQGLDNLVNKYRLLNESRVIIHESSLERTVVLPLITKTTETVL